MRPASPTRRAAVIDKAPLYYEALTFSNLKCFRDEHTVNLAAATDRPHFGRSCWVRTVWARPPSYKCWPGCGLYRRPPTEKQLSRRSIARRTILSSSSWSARTEPPWRCRYKLASRHARRKQLSGRPQNCTPGSSSRPPKETLSRVPARNYRRGARQELNRPRA